MKIQFGDKYWGKDTSEVPSSFLIWIIEEYKTNDSTLLDACKQELSSRLRLDWTPRSEEDRLKINAAAGIYRQNKKLLERIEQLTDLLGIAILSKGNEPLVNLCESSPEFIPELLESIRYVQQNTKHNE